MPISRFITNILRRLGVRKVEDSNPSIPPAARESERKPANAAASEKAGAASERVIEAGSVLPRKPVGRPGPLPEAAEAAAPHRASPVSSVGRPNPLPEAAEAAAPHRASELAVSPSRGTEEPRNRGTEELTN
jgi:hypothetical protein